MIGAKTVLALVMARGGSKGVPGKNLRHVGGKPMLAWTIEAARNSRLIDRTVLSSEDAEIIALARQLGCEVPFVRPVELAADDTPAMDVVHHAMANLEVAYDYLILLQPTSPLRVSEDIDGCLTLCHQASAPSAVSVTETNKSPYWMYRLGSDNRMTPLMSAQARPARRQDVPAYYVLNGAVFVGRCDWLATAADFLCAECVAYPMPAVRSLDVDDEFDVRVADLLLGSRAD